MWQTTAGIATKETGSPCRPADDLVRGNIHELTACGHRSKPSEFLDKVSRSLQDMHDLTSLHCSKYGTPLDSLRDFTPFSTPSAEIKGALSCSRNRDSIVASEFESDSCSKMLLRESSPDGFSTTRPSSKCSTMETLIQLPCDSGSLLSASSSMESLPALPWKRYPMSPSSSAGSLPELPWKRYPMTNRSCAESCSDAFQMCNTLSANPSTESLPELPWVRYPMSSKSY